MAGVAAVAHVMYIALHRRPVCRLEEVFQLVFFEFLALGPGHCLSLLQVRPWQIRPQIAGRIELNNEFSKTHELSSVRQVCQEVGTKS